MIITGEEFYVPRPSTASFIQCVKLKGECLCVHEWTSMGEEQFNSSPPWLCTYHYILRIHSGTYVFSAFSFLIATYKCHQIIFRTMPSQLSHAHTSYM